MPFDPSKETISEENKIISPSNSSKQNLIQEVDSSSFDESKNIPPELLDQDKNSTANQDFDQNEQEIKNGGEENTFCRICRCGSDSDEKEEEEPLFYPCSCSGSIKHVHESCLLEWLKHTNKKKCELCGYVFDFRPVYAPNTPEVLTFSEFFSIGVRKTVKTIPLCFRITLVFICWIFVVPLTTAACFKWLSLSGNLEFKPISIPSNRFLNTSLSYRPSFIEIEDSIVQERLEVRRVDSSFFFGELNFYKDHEWDVWDDYVFWRTGILVSVSVIAGFLSLLVIFDYVHGWNDLTEAIAENNSANSPPTQSRTAPISVRDNIDAPNPSSLIPESPVLPASQTQDIIQIAQSPPAEGSRERNVPSLDSVATPEAGELEDFSIYTSSSSLSTPTTPSMMDISPPSIHESTHIESSEQPSAVQNEQVQENSTHFNQYFDDSATDTDSERDPETVLEPEALEINLALDEFIGLRGSLLILIHNVVCLIVFNFIFLCATVHFPVSFGSMIFNIFSTETNRKLFITRVTATGEKLLSRLAEGNMVFNFEDNFLYEDTDLLVKERKLEFVEYYALEGFLLCLGHFSIASMIGLLLTLLKHHKLNDNIFLKKLKKGVLALKMILVPGCLGQFLLYSLSSFYQHLQKLQYNENILSELSFFKSCEVDPLWAFRTNTCVVDLIGPQQPVLSLYLSNPLTELLANIFQVRMYDLMDFDRALLAMVSCWAFGLTVMLVITVMVVQMREILHKDILRQIVRPNDPTANLLNLLLSESIVQHVRRLFISVLVYLTMTIQYYKYYSLNEEFIEFNPAAEHTFFVLKIVGTFFSGTGEILKALNLGSIFSFQGATEWVKFNYILEDVQIPVELAFLHYYVVKLFDGMKKYFFNAQTRILFFFAVRFNLVEYLLPIPVNPREKLFHSDLTFREHVLLKERKKPKNHRWRIAGFMLCVYVVCVTLMNMFLIAPLVLGNLLVASFRLNIEHTPLLYLLGCGVLFKYVPLIAELNKYEKEFACIRKYLRKYNPHKLCKRFTVVFLGVLTFLNYLLPGNKDELFDLKIFLSVSKVIIFSYAIWKNFSKIKVLRSFVDKQLKLNKADGNFESWDSDDKVERNFELLEKKSETYTRIICATLGFLGFSSISYSFELSYESIQYQLRLICFILLSALLIYDNSWRIKLGLGKLHDFLRDERYLIGRKLLNKLSLHT
eukprot:snap_masked-scaffold_10-processed-gene-4.47-mRNA-1 protein AED:1.00 eAED:1.00 QI:0/0/0/0/1/1/3/0/1190